MLAKEGVKIWRPRQLYVGEGKREYVEMEGRKRKEGGEKGGEPSQVRVLPRCVRLSYGVKNGRTALTSVFFSQVSHPTSKRVFLARQSARESKL